MSRIIIVIVLAFLGLSSFSQTYYIVRHAEKATQEPNMTSDVALSSQGQKRAEGLRDFFQDKKIAYIFSTNTVRTTTTAKPTADHFGVKIETYGPRPDSAFIAKLKSLDKNVLIVGHSNTVDDIVNMLCGKTEVAADLLDTEYNNIFMIKKEGGKMVYSRLTFDRTFN